ncbi:MAG: DUF5110 domain-containing protein, partial [Promethearchaeota archaeon]
KEKGPYFNLFTKEYHEGGDAISRAYEISDIPVFVKAGGIIPLDEDDKSNGTDNPKSIIVEIFPGASNKFQLYEDEGDTIEYKTGNYYITNLVLHWEEIVKFTIDQPKEKKSYIPQEREFTLRFNAIEDPKDVSLVSDKHISNEIEYEIDQKCLIIKLNSNDFTHLEISFKLPEIVRDNKIKEEAYQMLFDSRIHILRKRIIKKRFFNKNEFDLKRLKRLYHTISIGFH